MAGEQPIAWDLGHAPKQSITEVLQNPRGPSLELPELASFDLSASALSPAPITALPEPPNINHFEDYLRRYAPLHAQFVKEKRLLEAAHAPSALPDLSSIPDIYFDPHFSVARNPQLAALQPPTSSPGPLSRSAVVVLRDTLAVYRIALERALRARLATQSDAISASLTTARDLREQLHTAALAVRAAREASTRLVPAVADGLKSVQLLSGAQANVRALRAALGRMQLVMRAPADVETLLRSGEYDAAIRVVAGAKEALAHRDLAPVVALASVRARLAMAMESIDAALREEFREGLVGEAEGRDDILGEVVRLVGEMGRLPLLKGFFLKEIKTEVAKELNDVLSLAAAGKVIRQYAERALVLVTVIATKGKGKGEPDAKASLREVHEEFDKLSASVVDRFLTLFAVSSELSSRKATYIVLSDTRSLTEESCFDEFKGALTFGEEIRSLEETASELEVMFSSGRKSSMLRAKILERQFSFLGAFHKAHVDALSTAVHADRWQEFRVPRGATRLLAAVIVDAAVERSKTEQENGVSHVGSSTELESMNEDGTVVIGSDSFKTVFSGVRYLRSVCLYTLLAEKSPALASEIARRGSELSRLFNSLVGKAILGAFALQWSGLKSITARHLSLASRTIAMAAALAEHVHRPLEAALSESQVAVVLPLIQKSERDLRDHHGQLLAKILAIMMDRLKDHEVVLKSYPWDKAQEMQRFEIPSPYMTKLVKEATVLHRILWSILPLREVYDIFQRVCAAYGDHLSEAYGSLDGGKQWIRTRVSEDVICLHDTLMSLEVFQTNPTAVKPVVKLYSRFANNSDENLENAVDKSVASAKQAFIRSPKDVSPEDDPSQARCDRDRESGNEEGEKGDKEPPCTETNGDTESSHHMPASKLTNVDEDSKDPLPKSRGFSGDNLKQSTKDLSDQVAEQTSTVGIDKDNEDATLQHAHIETEDIEDSKFGDLREPSDSCVDQQKESDDPELKKADGTTAIKVHSPIEYRDSPDKPNGETMMTEGFGTNFFGEVPGSGGIDLHGGEVKTDNQVRTKYREQVKVPEGDLLGLGGENPEQSVPSGETK